MTTRSVPSFAELSLSPVFRRQWSSLYKVLERSELPSETLMKLYVEHLPQPPQNTQIVLAGDHTAWSRLWSPTLKERTYEHQPQKHPGAKPVTVGQGYSSLVCVPQMQGTWALPLLHERFDFSQHWHTSTAAQTPRKVSWMVYRSRENPSSTISHSEKELLATPI